MKYRTKPLPEEYFVLDRLDEKQITEGHGNLCHVLPNGRFPLVSIAYFGMLEIAKREKLVKVNDAYSQRFLNIHATCAVRNRRGCTRVGASATTDTPDTTIALAKAWRNAIRQAVSPAVLQKFVVDWLAYKI